MKNTEYKKIEPEGLRDSRIARRCLGISVVPASVVAAGVALTITGYNFLLANSYINRTLEPHFLTNPARDYLPSEKMEKLVQNPEAQFDNKFLEKLIIRNPIAKSGRDLAYFFKKEKILEKKEDEELYKRLSEQIKKIEKNWKANRNRK